MTEGSERSVAQLLVACLENEGVEYVFGLPGEENLHVIDALVDSPIRFVTARDERGAAFMADIYGALTGRAADHHRRVHRSEGGRQVFGRIGLAERAADRSPVAHDRVGDHPFGVHEDGKVFRDQR